jgi:hypothetical protein
MVHQLVLSVMETFILEDTMRTKVLTIAALATMSTATLASAQGGRGPGGRGGSPGGRCAMTADSLTDMQKSQVHAPAESFNRAHTPQLDSLRTIMEATRGARQAGKTPTKFAQLRKPANQSSTSWRPRARNSATRSRSRGPHAMLG